MLSLLTARKTEETGSRAVIGEAEERVGSRGNRKHEHDLIEHIYKSLELAL
jgi:hypothetical protein